MIKINFYKSIQKYSNKKFHYFYLEDLKSLFNGLKITFPEINTLLKDNLITIVYNKGKIIPESWFLRNYIPDEIEELWIIPHVQGAGGRFGKAAIGMALVAAAVFAGGGFGAQGLSGLNFGTGLTGVLGKVVLGVGINLVLSSLLQQELEGPKPPIENDVPQRRNNDAFDGLQNSLDTNNPVFLIYGEKRVSGQFISGYIKSINHGVNDLIRVGTFFK